MKMDMSQEKELVERSLIPEGQRKLQIVNAEQKTSKAGNEMIEWTICDLETNACDVVCTITTQGKRWALKNMLNACDVPIEDGEIYVFELEDLIGKTVIGINKHIDEEYIDRKGETKQSKKNKFTKFLPYEQKKTETVKDEEVPF